MQCSIKSNISAAETFNAVSRLPCISGPVGLCVCFCVMYLSTLVSEELPSVVDDLFVREVGVRLLLTNAQHLPQCDAESPHVTGCGELTL